MADPQELFNVITPRPFSLANQSESNLGKIRDEIMDKVTTWESRMGNPFREYTLATDSWRIRPGSERGSAKRLFNSKSGETHRAAETLGTLWQRMLTAQDPWFEALGMGLNALGQEVTEEELFYTVGVLAEQQRVLKFKKKLLRSLRSAALVGLAVAENPYISVPYGFGQKNMEYTDWVFRSIQRTGFDTAVYDLNDSEFIFFIDFHSKWILRNLASLDTEFWDIDRVEKHIAEFAKGAPASLSQAFSRLSSSRARAGYSDQDANVFENISYHGRLDPENPIIQELAESMGLDTDPKYVDWSANLLDGQDIAKFHMTQYGDWRTRARIISYKDFEDEPLPYGIGQLGRKLQREMDLTESLTNDKATFDILNMWKIGKYSGYDGKQFVAEPNKAVELEDVTQMLPLVGDPSVLRNMLGLIELRREDFRNIVGAQTNLQAQITKASATETAIAQNEAIRGAGVHAELIAEILREYLEVSHINNLNYLDDPIWIGLTGARKPALIDKNRLPVSIGFLIKMVTDKDFRPERVKNILQGLQFATSIRNLLPTSINMVRPLAEEYFRVLGINPGRLNEEVPLADIIENRLNRLSSQGGVQNEVEGEAAGAASGTADIEETPVGPVETSPFGSDQIVPELSA